jgi:hypothetical protein
MDYTINSDNIDGRRYTLHPSKKNVEPKFGQLICCKYMHCMTEDHMNKYFHNT